MNESSRRGFLWGAAFSGAAFGGCTKGSASAEEQDVAPPEDLMREHGVLNRILLIHDENASRPDTREPLPLDALAKGADIIRRFIEEYHEKLEEDFVFPRFEKASKLVDLVSTLRRQHAAGRSLTDAISRLIASVAATKDDDRRKLAEALRSFAHMYRPHEAREDTVLFPALRAIVGKNEFRELGEQFEKKEHQLFGKEGFEGIVEQVAKLEQSFGLYDLSQFTPASG